MVRVLSTSLRLPSAELCGPVEIFRVCVGFVQDLDGSWKTCFASGQGFCHVFWSPNPSKDKWPGRAFFELEKVSPGHLL